jgi:hypothetical protein
MGTDLLKTVLHSDNDLKRFIFFFVESQLRTEELRGRRPWRRFEQGGGRHEITAHVTARTDGRRTNVHDGSDDRFEATLQNSVHLEALSGVARRLPWPWRRFFTFIGFSSWTLRLVDEQATDNNEGAKAHADGAEPGKRSR